MAHQVQGIPIYARCSFASIAAAACLSAGIAATCARAHWPTDPGSPIIAGAAGGLFGPRLSLVAGEDGGVWIAWQDHFCGGGFVRLQRIAASGDLLIPGGLEVQDDPTCGFVLPPTMASIGSGVVVSRAESSLMEYPVERFAPDGSTVWTPGFSVPGSLTLAGAGELAGGDALIASRGFSSIHADRVDASGALVWGSQSVFGTASANFRVLAAIAEPGGGAYIFWDAPLAYTRLIFAMRLGADGETLWDSFVQILQPPPGVASSRHTDPVAIADGQGGAWIIWTRGFETGTAAAPLLVQRINPDGSLVFPIGGERVSLGVKRQFDVRAALDPVGGDLFLVWRDGQLGETTVRAQRLTPAADRLWGDEGAPVSPLDASAGSFDAVWSGGRLTVAIGGPGGASAVVLDAQGVSAVAPIDLGEAHPARYIRAVAAGPGVVAGWQSDLAGLEDAIVALRINAFNRLGDEPCNPADMLPDGELNFFDVSAYLSAFSAGDPIADLDGDGGLNFFDVSLFLGALAAGCP